MMTLKAHKRLRAMLCACMSVFVLLASSHSTAQNPQLRIRLPVSAEEIRDLEDIYQDGHLRVLYLDIEPGQVTVPRVEQDMLARFAVENGLSLEWIPAKNDWNLLSGLASGKVDIIVGQGRSLQAGIEGQARFTLPWGAAYEQVVARADSAPIGSLDGLAKRRVALKESSAAHNLLQDLSAKHPDMGIIEVPEEFGTESILNRVSSGEYDIAIISRDVLDEHLADYPELTVIYSVSVNEPRVWAVPEQSPQLQFALNEFLNKNHLQFNLTNIYIDDLPKLQEKRILRMITYRSPVNYYFANGKSYGFEYDLVSQFAKTRNMRVEVVLANTHEEMQQLLLQGRGDIIAASLPNSAFYSESIGFSEPYNYSVPILVGRAGGEELLDMRDLRGKRIILPSKSPFYSLLKNQQKHYGFELIRAGNGIVIADLLKEIMEGRSILTVVDQQLLKLKKTDPSKIKTHFSLTEPLPQGWAVRKNNGQLLLAVNEFIEKEYRGGFYNTLYANYFENPLQQDDFHNIFAAVDSISPYDAIVREYAEEYEFDWRLIVAQMYQESQFDPKAVSYAGAKGLMQVMPSTAKWIGAKDIVDPAKNIQAGIEYMNILRSQFEVDLPLEDRTWFTLAAYNAGFGRVVQARRLAEKMGLDPNRWFDNVENAMLALGKPYKKSGEKVRICRCGQTVVYVKEIRTLYSTYVSLTENTQLASLNWRNREPLGI